MSIIIDPHRFQESAAVATALYRIDCGSDGETAIDGGIDWEPDSSDNPSPYLVGTAKFGFGSVNSFDASVPQDTTPSGIWTEERWNSSDIRWLFPVDAGTYEVRCFIVNSFNGTNSVGDRVFDIEIEGTIVFDELDMVATYGHRVAAMLSHTVAIATAKDLSLNFLKGTADNPIVNGIEILQF